jgi:hypothetical protein
MDNLTRTELKMILEGLHLVRDERRKELKAQGVEFLFSEDEYKGIVILQEKVLRVLDRMTY